MQATASSDRSLFDLDVPPDTGTRETARQPASEPSWRARAALDPLAALIDGGSEAGVDWLRPSRLVEVPASRPTARERWLPLVRFRPRAALVAAVVASAVLAVALRPDGERADLGELLPDPPLAASTTSSRATARPGARARQAVARRTRRRAAAAGRRTPRAAERHRHRRVDRRRRGTPLTTSRTAQHTTPTPPSPRSPAPAPASPPAPRAATAQFSTEFAP